MKYKYKTTVYEYANTDNKVEHIFVEKMDNSNVGYDITVKLFENYNETSTEFNHIVEKYYD